MTNLVQVAVNAERREGPLSDADEQCIRDAFRALGLGDRAVYGYYNVTPQELLRIHTRVIVGVQTCTRRATSSSAVKTVLRFSASCVTCQPLTSTAEA